VGPDNAKCHMLVKSGQHYFKYSQYFQLQNHVFWCMYSIVFWCHYCPVHWVISTKSKPFQPPI